MSTHRVVYRLLLTDETDDSWAGPAGVMDEICVEFDTTFCMPGHPFRIIRDGIWFIVAGGEMEIDESDPENMTVIFNYREETDAET
ncbi:MAG: hypothetical protein GY906_10095 [bacterium]|nr:hypothetical protein [bacterium]